MMTSGHDIAMGLRAAYLLMHRQTNYFLSPFGMTADQFVLLALLAEEDGITQQELSQRASSDPNTIRAMLLLMEKNALVARRQDPADGRARRVMLTRKGRRTYDRLSASIKPLQEHLSGPFGREGTDKLVELLDNVSDAMRQWENGNETPQGNKFVKGED